MTDPTAITGLQARLDAINVRIASGVKDVRFNNRSTTFDLGVLQQERQRIEAQLSGLGAPGASAPVRRLLAVQRTKGL